MVKMRKPKIQVFLALGVLLTAQCCCCVIPIRWRVRTPKPTNISAEISQPASLVDWGVDLASELKDLAGTILPEATTR